MGKASFSGQFKIGTRIYSGYGLVLAFLCVVVILGYMALDHIGSNVIEFDRVSDNSVRVLILTNISGSSLKSTSTIFCCFSQWSAFR